MEKKEVIYGRNPVLEYLKQIDDSAGTELYISDSAHGKIIDIIISEAKKRNIQFQFCNRDFLFKYHSSSKHQGVVLIASLKRDNLSDDEFIKNTGDKSGLIVLLDQLTDPHNIGSIIRTTEALGGDAVAFPRANSPEINATIKKTAAGATAYLKTFSISNVAQFLENAKKSGFWIIGSDEDGNEDLTRLKELKPAVIIIGNEGTGMRRLTREKCDYIFRIPLKGRISSLNASVAAGILIYEAMRK
jgi:23S rRNA (guanosine2251-2'-O)-methyltransferase